MKTALIVCVSLSLLVVVFATPPECISVRRLSGSVCENKDFSRDRRSREFDCCEDTNLVPLRTMGFKDGKFQQLCLCITPRQLFCHHYPMSCSA